MENILEVKNVNKKYESFELKDISFELPKGMIMGFIGENGAGKTTVIKSMLDLLQKDSGEVEFIGIDKEDIGVVLDGMFFPEILTPKNVDDTMKEIYKNWDSNLFNQYLKEFDLKRKQQIKTFSKGMRKKLEIATALAHHPKLLILDEPTSGLDPVARSEILDIFQSFIEQEDSSIFFSSHITTDLEHIADYITFIDNGTIILSKTCDELINNYGIVKCTEEQFLKFDKKDYIKYKKNRYEYEVLVIDKRAFQKKYQVETIDKVTLDELMVLMIKGEESC